MKRLLAVLLAVLGLSASLFAATTIDLSDIPASRTELLVENDTTLTGSLLVPTCQVKIKDGARVTLDEAFIHTTDGYSYWAPITCLGDATLVVKGRWNHANASGGPEGHPGIYVPKGYTLTIEGDGVLAALGAAKGAGIGCGDKTQYGGECGTIEIKGGDITAKGGEYAAGIGGAYHWTSGHIHISGGTVNATGGRLAAGIGSGYMGFMSGDIEIDGGKVVASGGADGAAGIGGGSNGQSGSILIYDSSSVTATGTVNSAGIGTGPYGSVYGNIEIRRGSTVYAQGGSGAPGIGAGLGGTFSQYLRVGISFITAKCGTGCTKPIGKILSNGTCIDCAWQKPDGDCLVDETVGDTRKIRWNGDLSVRSLNFPVTAIDGMTLYGNTTDSGGRWKLSIAHGATVTLSNAYINTHIDVTGWHRSDTPWAGINCEGSATLILKGANYVKPFHVNYPGIFVPVGKTLTIEGHGNLTSSSKYGAGIGGGYGIDCGGVTINDGIVNATSDVGGAGIGGGYAAKCRGVFVYGGAVNARGGVSGAGIGSSGSGEIEYLRIDQGAVVVAEGGRYAAGIGTGRNGKVMAATGFFYVGPSDVTAIAGDATAEPIGAGDGGFLRSQPSVASYTGLKDTTSGATRTLRWDGDLDNWYLRWNPVAHDGTTITGTMSELTNYKVFIAPNATVTLSDVTIVGRDYSVASPHAGITCIGNATFILEGDNYVRPYGAGMPGVAYYQNRTLKISNLSTGTIDAGGDFPGTPQLLGASLLDAEEEEYGGAGFGAGYNEDGGNLVIEGGTVIATGGYGAAGIGGAHGGNSGNVTISGGTVDAEGGYGAAGIGSGDDDSASGDITISGGSVSATGGDGADAIGAGSGSNSTCGNVKVRGMSDTTDTSTNTRTLEELEWDGNLATLTKDVIVPDGMTLYGTLSEQYRVMIAPGATVTLNNANIDNDSLNFSWPGLTCLGSAKIILDDASDNTIKGGMGMPGIFVPLYDSDPKAIVVPESGLSTHRYATLTIDEKRGEWRGLVQIGELDVSGTGIAAGIGGHVDDDFVFDVNYDFGVLFPSKECGHIIIEGGVIRANGGTEGGPGIGSFAEGVCGDVVIKGGFVTAAGGDFSPGIGGGVSSWPNSGIYAGNLTILGGTIVATGGDAAPGIGGGAGCKIGNIVIKGGTVEAYGGDNAPGIGGGSQGSCGNITVEPGVVSVIAEKGLYFEGVNPVGPGDDFVSCGTITLPQAVDGYNNVLSNAGYTRTITPISCDVDGVIDLSTLDHNVVVTYGKTLTGTLSGDYKVSIVHGANIELDNVRIPGASSSSNPHAGITCLGDAEFVLTGDNYVRPYGQGKAAVANSQSNLSLGTGVSAVTYPVVYTLSIYKWSTGTIDVSGVLPTTPEPLGASLLDANEPEYGGAGIGASYNEPCGDIVIEGGTILARGGNGAAGIGGAVGGACGDITIQNGLVSATSGGDGADAIGAGGDSTCGDVTVDGNLVDHSSGETRTISTWDGCLPKLESDAVAYDQIVISGDLRCPVKITIADGATVTLSNATIMVNGANNSDYRWAGLNCAGDATIILKGTNRIRGFDENYPGIYVPPSGTLTFEGDGTLRTMSRGKAAGIGGGSNLDCGAIVIRGGIIQAEGGDYSAGIGGGYNALCDYVVIEGGKVVATGKRGGAGIGTGYCGSIGYVAMEGGEVNAKGGQGAAGVGAGRGGTIVYDENDSEPSIRIDYGFLGAWGGDRAPGIGFGCDGSRCGQIKITGGTTTAYSGKQCNYTIGAGTESNWADCVKEVRHAGYELVDDQGHPKRTITTVCDLGVLTDSTVTLYDGTYVTGTLETNTVTKLVIAPDSTIVLSNALVKGSSDGDNRWAGLTCLGNATIILKETNTVRGYCRQGIYVPEGSTLTINGDGSLTAQGRSDPGLNANNVNGAGIGACTGTSCGNITILGGTIIARGSSSAAGIGGSGNANCGDISIQGGDITATGYGPATGIGCGSNGNCGTIDIGAGIVQVTAEISGYGAYTNALGVAIGTGGNVNGTCGAITVDPALIDEVATGTRTIRRWDGNLATVDRDVIAVDGTIIYGTLSGNYKVSIADGATVTLNNATIPGSSSMEDNAFAGLTCLGDATIMLENANTVRGYRRQGIAVPVGSTLTIDGDGSLTVQGKGDSGAISTALFGAGIGACTKTPCGNITILGGTINATGDMYSAGIGGGYQASCGDISIEGGSVTAMGGYAATGIGCGGWNSVCGTIDIGAEIDMVVAKCSGYSTPCTNSIGAAFNTTGTDATSCGTITVDSNLLDSTDSSNTYYTRTITPPAPAVWDGNLDTLAADVTVSDGMTLYGTLQGYYKVSIAAGATVTLSNATINLEQDQNCEWAGLNCLGSARIVLEGVNSVKGCHIYYPGIHVPAGSTLTIAGSGSLSASSNGRGAGIGGGWNISCGNIVIESGMIYAIGGTYCAGIGSGYPYKVAVACGSITVNGGMVNAIGGNRAAGIGGGYGGQCGTVTIGSGITSVEATRGTLLSGDVVHPIGSLQSSVWQDPVVDSSLNDTTTQDGRTRSITPGGGSYGSYVEWIVDNGLSGDWDDVDASGVANVFRYAFDVPTGDFGKNDVPPLLSITFDEYGRVVILTPELVNDAGFTFTIEASDNLDGTGNRASTLLDPSGRTQVVEPTLSAKRFFRLKATEK